MKNILKVRYKTCYCHNCNKSFHPLGIQRHRAAHRDRGEDCTITYTTGETMYHDFSKWKKTPKENKDG